MLDYFWWELRWLAARLSYMSNYNRLLVNRERWEIKTFRKSCSDYTGTTVDTFVNAALLNVPAVCGVDVACTPVPAELSQCSVGLIISSVGTGGQARSVSNTATHLPFPSHQITANSPHVYVKSPTFTKLPPLQAPPGLFHLIRTK